MGLILNRKLEESFDVDGPASIKVISIERGRVTVLIDAPDTTTVTRPDMIKDQPPLARRRDAESPEIPPSP